MPLGRRRTGHLQQCMCEVSPCHALSQEAGLWASAMLSNVMLSIAMVTKMGHRFALQHVAGQRSKGML